MWWRLLWFCAAARGIGGALSLQAAGRRDQTIVSACASRRGRMRKARSILTLVMLGAAGSVLPTGCESEGTTVLDVAVPQQGQVQLNLVGVSSSGTAYRLRQAIIVVQGPSSTTFLDSDVAPDSTSLGATV